MAFNEEMTRLKSYLSHVPGAMTDYTQMLLAELSAAHEKDIKAVKEELNARKKE